MVIMATTNNEKKVSYHIQLFFFSFSNIIKILQEDQLNVSCSKVLLVV